MISMNSEILKVKEEKISVKDGGVNLNVNQDEDAFNGQYSDSGNSSNSRD